MRAGLQQLVHALRDLETQSAHRAASSSQMQAIPTGWPSIDAELGGGLARASIHEWIGSALGNDRTSSASRWFPPMTVLIHLAHAALHHAADPHAVVVWIGRNCWPSNSQCGLSMSDPHPQSKIPNPNQRSAVAESKIDSLDLLHHSLFIDPPDEASHLWSIDLALRSRAVGVVIADGSHLPMAATRRLQLAAEAGGCVGLLARPPWEAGAISAARTRWRVHSHRGVESTLHNPHVKIQFTISLLRCKGVRPAAVQAMSDRSWTLELDHAENGLHFFPDVANRSDPAAA